MHVLFDGMLKPEGCSSLQLFDWLKDAPKKFDMVAITPAQVLGAPPNFKGIIVLAESHIAVHIEHDAVYIDVFTCKPIDVVKAKEVVQELPVNILRTRVVDRGLEFIREVAGG